MGCRSETGLTARPGSGYKKDATRLCTTIVVRIWLRASVSQRRRGDLWPHPSSQQTSHSPNHEPIVTGVLRRSIWFRGVRVTDIHGSPSWLAVTKRFRLVPGNGNWAFSLSQLRINMLSDAEPMRRPCSMEPSLLPQAGKKGTHFSITSASFDKKTW